MRLLNCIVALLVPVSLAAGVPYELRAVQGEARRLWGRGPEHDRTIDPVTGERMRSTDRECVVTVRTYADRADWERCKASLVYAFGEGERTAHQDRLRAVIIAELAACGLRIEPATSDK